MLLVGPRRHLLKEVKKRKIIKNRLHHLVLRLRMIQMMISPLNHLNNLKHLLKREELDLKI
jgi:hypothetical protein